MIKIGLVGCGLVSETHMTVYSLIPEADVVAVADVMPERAKEIARKFRVERVFSSHQDLLASGDLDLVDICTPTSTHKQIARDAAREGCHVLVEKPMARTSKECVEMAETARKRRVQLGVCHNLLFHPVIGQLRGVVESGEVGLAALRTFIRSPAGGVARRLRWVTTPEEGGVLWEMGCHAAYVHNHFLGEISEVRAFAKKVFSPVEDLFLVLLRSRDGAVGEMDFFWGAKEKAWNLEIETTDGERFVADVTRDYVERKSILAREYVRENFPKLLREVKAAFSKRVIYSLRLLSAGARFAQRSHYLLIEGMLESIREPAVPPPVTAEDGMAAVTLLERIDSALRESKSE